MTASGRQDLYAQVPAAFAANVRFYASLFDGPVRGSDAD